MCTEAPLTASMTWSPPSVSAPASPIQGFPYFAPVSVRRSRPVSAPAASQPPVPYVFCDVASCDVRISAPVVAPSVDGCYRLSINGTCEVLGTAQKR